MKQFKDRIQYLMDIKNLNQSDIAEGIGTNKSRVHEWVKGTIKQPQRKTLRKIAGFTSCELDWLETGKGDPFPPEKEETAETITTFDRRKAAKEIDTTLAQLNRLRFKQQCGSVFFDDFFDYVAENYGEDQEGVAAFLSELYNIHPNYRSWKEKKNAGETDKNKGLDNLSADK
jgi:transcriptional regulator with XRE-family HTH domain